jgi:dephospho-CoA kinase
MRILVLTGGIASGKSTFIKKFKELYSHPVASADEMANQINQTFLFKLYLRILCPHVLENNQLNKRLLAKLIFENNSYRRLIELFIHPLVAICMIWFILKNWITGQRILLMEVPLWFESRFWKFTKGNNILMVCQEKERINRILHRDGISQQEAINIIDSQLGDEFKIPLADYIIDTSKNIDLQKEIENIIKE